ncbi:UTRA domain-containing protein [Bacillus sp. SL00103]
MAHAKQELEANVASKEEAHVLSISTGDPVLSIARTTYFQNDVPFEYVLSVYRGDVTSSFIQWSDKTVPL